MHRPSNPVRKPSPRRPLDRIDRALVAAVQQDARLSNKELAAIVELAPSSCLARMRRLEADGVIRGWHAELDPAALGLGLQAMIAVQLRLHVRESFETFAAHLRALPEVLGVWSLGGTTDFLVHVVCRDTAHLQVVTVEGFTARPEVSRIETSLVFSHWRGQLPVPGDDD